MATIRPLGKPSMKCNSEDKCTELGIQNHGMKLLRALTVSINFKFQDDRKSSCKSTTAHVSLFNEGILSSRCIYKQIPLHQRWKANQSNNGLTTEVLESARIIVHHLCLYQEIKIQNVTIGSNHDEYLKNRLVEERELSAFVSSWPTRKDTPYKPRWYSRLSVYWAMAQMAWPLRWQGLKGESCARVGDQDPQTE